MSTRQIVFFLSLTTLSLASQDNCSTKLPELEKALYANGTNLLHLNSAFFPSRGQPSRFIKVVFEFTDGYDEDDCNVTFFWSVGSFLFIQPPSVFTYTSLLFNFPSNSVDNITIILPNECRPLVNNNNNNNNNDMCSCGSEEMSFLEMLTRHLTDYAKVNSPDLLIRDEVTLIRTVCGENLKRRYYEDLGVQLFFAMILLLPFGLLTMVALFVRLHRRRLEKKCIKPSNHGNLAGVILTGMFIMIYIIIMDVLAVWNFNSHEYTEYNVKHSLNFYVPVITLVLNFLAMAYSVTAWLLFVSWTCTYRNCHGYSQSKINSCLRNSLKCIFAPYLYLVFGYKKHDKFWKEEDNDQTDQDRDITENVFAVRQVWALLSLLIGPLFGFFSHVCYVMVAWLTEPQKTSAVFVLAMFFLIYLFTLFRSVYRSSERYSAPSTLSDRSTGKRVLQFFESFFHCCIVCCANFNCNYNKELKSVDIGEEYVMESIRSVKLEKQESNRTIIFSKAKLLSTFIIGILASIPLALTVIGISYLPIPALHLADHITHLIMIGLVIFGALATHKILSLKEPQLNLLIERFKENYENQRFPNRKLSENLFEACGEIAGEVCRTLQQNKGYPLSQHRLGSIDDNVKDSVDHGTKATSF